VLAAALAHYDELRSTFAWLAAHASRELSGGQIVELVGTGSLAATWMGRLGGWGGQRLGDDIATGRWESQRYQVSAQATAPNWTWFSVGDFVAAVSGGEVPSQNAGRVIMYGDVEVPVIERPWRAAADVPGYRMTYRLLPGQRWRDAPWSDSQYEHLPVVAGEVLPVGVAVAAELVDQGADWAYCTEMFGGLVLLDHRAVCVAVEGPVADVLDRLREANGGSLSGLPDVIAQRGAALVLREAKRRGQDRLQSQQHEFARAAQRLLGPNLDLAVVEWDLKTTTLAGDGDVS
jgi:hypothetical protein